MPFLFLLFLAVPVAEIAVFIQVDSWIGLWPTLGGIVLTAVIGAALVRAQGVAALGRAQAQIQQNKAPVAEIFTAACLLIAGALLLTPGFLTDTVGFLLLIPGLRERMGRSVVGLFTRNARFTMHSAGMHHPGGPGGPGYRGGMGRGDGVIDGEYETIDPDEPTKPKESPKPANDAGPATVIPPSPRKDGPDA